VATLKTTIAAKLNSKGIIGKLKELLRRPFQYLDAESTSLRERREIRPTTTADPYWGSPGVVTIEMTLEEIALEEIALVETILNSIRTPL
jgi:hypothetical protein